MNEQNKKEFFDLSEQDFISYFKEKIGPNFEKFKESASSLYSKADLIRKTKINFWWIVINLIIFLLIPINPVKIFFGVLVLLGVISSIWEPLQYKKMQNPNLKYVSKEKLIKALGLDYFALKTFYGQNTEYNNEPKMQEYKAYYKIVKEVYPANIDEIIQSSYHNMPFSVFDMFGQIEGAPVRKEGHQVRHNSAVVLISKINKPFKEDVRICGYSWGKVALEDIEFSKHFSVEAKDQVEARYLLTPSFMTRLLEYKKKLKRPFSVREVLFTQKYPEQGNILICIQTGDQDMFAFDRWQTDNMEAAAKAIYKILQEIKEIMQVVEALKLDQDIGM